MFVLNTRTMLRFQPIHATNAYMGIWLHLFLNSLVNEGMYLAPSPGRCAPHERIPGTHRIGGLVGTIIGLNLLKNRKFSCTWRTGPAGSLVIPPATKFRLSESWSLIFFFFFFFFFFYWRYNPLWVCILQP